MLSLIPQSTAIAVAVPPRPFTLSPDPRFLYDSRSYASTLGDVREAVERGDSLVLVTGEPGTGKTTLCRGLLAHLDYRTIVSIVMDPGGGIEDFLDTVLRDFGVAVPGAGQRQRPQLVFELQRFLTSLIPLNARALVIVDEAQHLPPAVLEEIRLLLNCQTEHRTLLQVVLVGQPSTSLTPLLAQRVSRRCHLGTLHADEVQGYVEHRLRVNAADTGIPGDVTFTPTAMRALVRLSGGVPRVVNLLCERALDAGQQRGTTRIGVTMMLRGARQVARPSLLKRMSNTRKAAALVLAIAAGGTTLGATAYWWNGRHVDPGSAQPASTQPSNANAAAAVAIAPIVAPVVEPVDTGTLASIDGVVVRTSASALGPFLSADEARGLQRGISQPVGTVSASASSETFFQRVAMVHAGGRVSAVIELTAEPRQISTQTLTATTLDVDLGPLAALPRGQELNAPDGAPLIDHVSVRGTATESGPHAKVRLTLWRPATPTVRISGRRVYVDFDTPDADVMAPRPAPARRVAAAAAVAPATTPATTAAATPAPRAPETSSRSRDAMKAAAARFQEMLPFLISASQSSPEVRNALAGSLAELQSSIRDITPEAPSQHAHELLSSAIGLATHAARADFKGDRAAEAKQAAALFTAAQRELQ